MNDIDAQALVAAMTPDIHQKFKTAIELRKWQSGEPLTQEQLEVCMQAVIAYEHQHLPEHERTGYVPPKTEPCADDSHIHTHETPLKWRN